MRIEEESKKEKERERELDKTSPGSNSGDAL